MHFVKDGKQHTLWLEGKVLLFLELTINLYPDLVKLS